ncbi:MAG: peptide chain release factor N(5)-glutamine methyltransferase [Chitinivibrionales bacterium]|nr:peptide chain release factor N(5)-glutamine methyltransferase [Chitinivibrionales bacterium]MBD3357334.1 peptide chain release factor N(5)-glutamine methyltransferase [Chitinivibrionales bacterium]
MPPQQIGPTLRAIRKRLQMVAGETARYEAERILTHVLRVDRSRLYIDSSSILDDDQSEQVNRLVEKRLTGQPLAYVLGVAYFHSSEFFVSPSVLIPRPETELLVETILEKESDSECVFLDMGTGTGAIASVLVRTRHRWRAVAVDSSSEAISVARRNCPAAVGLVRMDRLEAISGGSAFDFVASNPPYISAEEMEHLEANVAEFEPHSALYGGLDGMDFYRYLARYASRHLKEGGRLYCEIGASQAESVGAILHGEGWKEVHVSSDLAGRDRIVRAHT